MTPTDDRRDTPLPVTSEVGSEGGSFADPTTQVATFEGELPRTGEQAAETQPADDDKTAADVVKYPSEG